MSSRHPRLAAALALAAAALPARALAADEVQGVVAASGGYTDNAGGSDETTAAASPFLLIQPSLVYFRLAPRTVQRLTLGVTTSLFAADNARQFNTYAADLGWSVAHSLSPTVDVLFDVGANLTQTNTSALTAGAGVAVPGATLGGDSRFVGARASQGLAKELSPEWRFTQGLLAAYVEPLDAEVGASFSSTLAFSFDRVREDDTVSLLAGAGNAWIDGEPVDQHILQVSAGLRWNHRLLEHWRTELQGGGLYALDVSGDGDPVLAPIGGASLIYQVDEGTAALAYSRGAALNPFIGQTLLTDDVSLRGGVPLLRDQVTLGMGIGAQRSRTLIADPMAVDFGVDILYADVGLAWRTQENLELGARYSYSSQTSADGTMLPDVVRNVFLVTVAGRWPGETEARMPYAAPMRMEPREDAEPPADDPPPAR